MSESKDKEHSECFVKFLKLFNACCGGCLTNNTLEEHSSNNVELPSDTVLVLEVNKIDSQIITPDDDFINIDKIELNNEIEADLTATKNANIKKTRECTHTNIHTNTNANIDTSTDINTCVNSSQTDSENVKECGENIDSQIETTNIQIEESITKIEDNNLFEKKDNYF